MHMGADFRLDFYRRSENARKRSALRILEHWQTLGWQKQVVKDQPKIVKVYALPVVAEVTTQNREEGVEEHMCHLNRSVQW